MKNIHFVGIGGIGMSGLAAAAKDLGWQVSGSDRAAERPENRRIFGALKNQGITVYPQDGSRFDLEELPDTVIYSTAIEEDNPDFQASPGIARLHRSELLGELLAAFGKSSIAVTGSCGKSTVSCYLSEVLTALGGDPVLLAGGLANAVSCDKFAGNYRPGRGGFLVFEADESDKSLLNYGADYAIVLNIGTDHYDKEELARVFGTFLQQVRKGAVMTRQVFDAVKKFLPPQLPVTVVDPDGGKGAFALQEYTVSAGEKGKTARVRCGDGRVITLPKMGRHMAENALCIRAMAEMLGFDAGKCVEALATFSGVWRRDDFAGESGSGAQVFDDYAHNPEKILSCLRGMRERCDGRIFAVFQPHGYKPFGFMKDELFALMENFLRPDDRFYLLEPYYAGGTSSFSPGGKEVAGEWRKNSATPQKFDFIASREAVRQRLAAEACAGDVVVVMGARDNSLSDFARTLAAN